LTWMTAASELPRAAGVAAGIADADRVGVNAKAQAANPIIATEESFGASE
jgi:hypothetical protein